MKIKLLVALITIYSSVFIGCSLFPSVVYEYEDGYRTPSYCMPPSHSFKLEIYSYNDLLIDKKFESILRRDYSAFYKQNEFGLITDTLFKISKTYYDAIIENSQTIGKIRETKKDAEFKFLKDGFIKSAKYGNIYFQQLSIPYGSGEYTFFLVGFSVNKNNYFMIKCLSPYVDESKEKNIENVIIASFSEETFSSRYNISIKDTHSNSFLVLDLKSVFKKYIQFILPEGITQEQYAISENKKIQTYIESRLKDLNAQENSLWNHLNKYQIGKSDASDVYTGARFSAEITKEIISYLDTIPAPPFKSEKQTDKYLEINTQFKKSLGTKYSIFYLFMNDEPYRILGGIQSINLENQSANDKIVKAKILMREFENNLQYP